MQSLYKAAKSFPDKNAAEDRAAVSAAVRGASSTPVAGPPPSYGRMTDAEFTAENAKFGF